MCWFKGVLQRGVTGREREDAEKEMNGSEGGKKRNSLFPHLKSRAQYGNP